VNTYYRWKREAEAFAVLDHMREAGLSFDEIEAIVATLERERESRR
jgi:pentatricopeptide repeat protein